MAASHGVKEGQVKISKRVEKELHHTKVLVRRMPPDMTEEKLLEAWEIPQCNYFYFEAGGLSLCNLATSRAYFSFVDEAAILHFRDKYDGMPMQSAKGQTYQAVIEFAPYQGIPKRAKKKVDGRMATIEQDAEYQSFLDTLNEKKQPPTLTEICTYVDSLAASKVPDVQKTPLIEYLTENHRRIVRTSKRSKAAGDVKKKRSKELKSTKESRFKGEGSKDGGSASKDWGTGKSKRELREKGGKRSEFNGLASSSYSTASVSVASDKSSGSALDRSKEKERGRREGGGRGWRGDSTERDGDIRRERGRAWRGDSTERDGDSRRERGRAWRGEGGESERDGEKRREKGGQRWKEGEGSAERDGEREGRERGRRGGRRGKKDRADEGWGGRADGGRRKGERTDARGESEGGSGSWERRSRQSGEEELKDRESSTTKNKDRPDQAIYSPRGRSRGEPNHTIVSEGSAEVRKVAKEREESSHGLSSRSDGWKKREQVNGEKSQPRSRGGWSEHGGGEGKGRRNEGGGGGRRGKNREAHYASASSFHDK